MLNDLPTTLLRGCLINIAQAAGCFIGRLGVDKLTTKSDHSLWVARRVGGFGRLTAMSCASSGLGGSPKAIHSS